MQFLACSLGFALGGAAGAPSCITDVGVGLHKDVPCTTVPPPGPGGKPMHVTYNVPPQCLSKSCGLIVDVHGLTMNADIEDANTNMRELGARHGFVVVQPTASPDVVPLNHWGDHAEDAIVAWIQTALDVPNWNIDRSRVHFMGFSEGASLAWDMHARHADLFASIVAMEFGHSEFAPNMTQVPILFQNGRKDPNWLLAPKTVLRLREAWGADEGTTLAEDSTFSHVRYMSNQGIHFDFLVHDYVADYAGLGHCFPGSHDTEIINHTSGEVPLVGPFGCPGILSRHNASYFIGDKAIAFFIEHPRCQEAGYVTPQHGSFQEPVQTLV